MPEADVLLEPFFLDSPRGPLFCLLVSPSSGKARKGVLYLHPFAEEMHKSRRMAALQARALAAGGYSVLLLDLGGCGDSHGDFSDATWDGWLQDVELAHAWLANKINAPVLYWGLRAGALLAAQASQKSLSVDALVFWQPTISGSTFLTQFLRIKLASEMLSSGQTQTGTKQLRDQLKAGESVEVGGYGLSPEMASGIESAKLDGITPTCPVFWFETGGESENLASPASSRIVESWRTHGVQVATRAVLGEPFWLTQEITECPALIDATKKALCP